VHLSALAIAAPSVAVRLPVDVCVGLCFGALAGLFKPCMHPRAAPGALLAHPRRTRHTPWVYPCRSLWASLEVKLT